MSVAPDQSPLPPPEPDPASSAARTGAALDSEPRPRPRRRVKLWHLCVAIFTLEIGLFLIIFPWRDTWYLNYFRMSYPLLEEVWDQPLFRGAISAVGVLNLYFAIVEFLRAFRRSA